MDGNEVSVQTLNAFKVELETSLKDAQFSLKLAKDRQASESSQIYKPSSCMVELLVWIKKSLFKDAYSRS